jgi:hypothetical protein
VYICVAGCDSLARYWPGTRVQLTMYEVSTPLSWDGATGSHDTSTRVDDCATAATTNGAVEGAIDRVWAWLTAERKPKPSCG